MAATASSTLCLLLFASATVLQAQARVALLTGEGRLTACV
jgi:hypothetical protein